MKKLLSVALILAGSLSLFACGKGNSVSSEGHIDIKLGHIQSETDVWNEASQKFKEEVEKNSNGEITVTIYPNSTLGGDRDLVEGMQSGTVDMGLIAGVLGNFEPSIQLLEIPYLFDNEDQYKQIINGPVGDEIRKRVLDRAGVRILDFWDRGSRQISSNKPITSLSDIAGLKIRIPEIQAMKVVWEAMGAAPTTMAWNEVYTALEQNVIEAEENPIPFMYSGKIQEVQKYIALSNHKYEYVTLSISDLTWNKLTDKQKKVVQEAADKATSFQNQRVVELTKQYLEDMKKAGMQVTEVNTDEFIAAARPAGNKFGESIDKELFQSINNELGRQ